MHVSAAVYACLYIAHEGGKHLPTTSGEIIHTIGEFLPSWWNRTKGLPFRFSVWSVRRGKLPMKTDLRRVLTRVRVVNQVALWIQEPDTENNAALWRENRAQKAHSDVEFRGQMFLLDGMRIQPWWTRQERRRENRPNKRGRVEVQDGQEQQTKEEMKGEKLERKRWKLKKKRMSVWVSEKERDRKKGNGKKLERVRGNRRNVP